MNDRVNVYTGKKEKQREKFYGKCDEAIRPSMKFIFSSGMIYYLSDGSIFCKCVVWPSQGIQKREAEIRKCVPIASNFVSYCTLTQLGLM